MVLQEIRQRCGGSELVAERLSLYGLSIEDINICRYNSDKTLCYALQEGRGRGKGFTLAYEADLKTVWIGVKAKAEKPKPAEKPVPSKPGKDELEKLKQTVLEAKAKLDNAQAEARKVEENVRQLVAREKDAYLKTIIPYRDACKKAGVECEFGGGRLTNVTERVSFLVEKVDKGIKVAIKGKPETEEVISFAKLKESVTKASYDYTDRHLGPKEEIGNKGGGLSNRLRALLK